MTFRVRKDNFVWDGVKYNQGDIVDIPDGNPRIRAMVEQSRVIEYANVEMPGEKQGISVHEPVQASVNILSRLP